LGLDRKDVVFVSRQLGHASPNITLGVYGHLFEQRAHTERARDELEAAFGAVLQPTRCARATCTNSRAPFRSG
jgi:hypothetical protein